MGWVGVTSNHHIGTGLKHNWRNLWSFMVAPFFFRHVRWPHREARALTIFPCYFSVTISICIRIRRHFTGLVGHLFRPSTQAFCLASQFSIRLEPAITSVLFHLNDIQGVNDKLKNNIFRLSGQSPGLPQPVTNQNLHRSVSQLPRKPGTLVVNTLLGPWAG